MSKQYVSMSVNELYPFELPLEEGAVSDFLRSSSNRLLVVMPDISAYEAKVLRKGEMRGGFLAKNGAMLFLWQFMDKGKRLITLDSPFDSRVIPDINLHNVETTETRLVIEVHIVDSVSKIIRGLRSITMPPGMTLEFFSAVQDQIANTCSGEKQHQKWMMSQPHDLTKRTQMWLLGK